MARVRFEILYRLWSPIAKRCVFLVAFLAVAFAATPAVRAQPGPPVAPTPLPMQKASLPHTTYHPNYHTKYHTIAHEMLDDEFGLGIVTPDMYALLDNVVDWVKAALPARTATEYRALDEAGALSVLTTIDKVLYNHGFVYPAYPMGWVDLLSDGLTPRTFNADELKDIRDLTSENDRRTAAIDAIGSGPFYLVDCDIASFLYLAVADVLHMPIAMVDLPSHDFIRWDLGGGTYVNFETMYGSKSSDADFAGFGQTAASVKAGLFMTAWTSDETLGYHAQIIASKWSGMNDYVRERHLGQYAAALYPRFVNAWNEIAWADVMADDPKVRTNPLTLVEAQKAVAGFAYANNLDTLACAQAEAGQWTDAVKTETSAETAFNDFPDAENFSKYVPDFVAHRTCFVARAPQNNPLPVQQKTNRFRALPDRAETR